ncbi:MAG: TonB-dependent receptor [Gammaproteobacteria bacterium]|nr:TonB-dependent receptor [Gammaproteobacteria bacterium]
MQRKIRRSLAMASSLSLLAVPAALAQHPDLEEIVVTANPLRASAMDLAQSAVVLSGDDLTRQVGASLGESLAAQPGVTASYFGPKASRPVIRGLSGERVLMLLDGVSALDVSNLSPDHSVAVEPLLADQIEVLKGPTTLLYGSGAVGGVVNTVDGRLPTRRDAGPLSGGLELRGDTASDERSVAGRLDGRTGAFGWHVDGYSRDTSDIEIPGLDWSKYIIAEELAEGAAIEATDGKVPNSDSESQGYTAGLSWFGADKVVSFAYGRAETNYGLPGPAEHAHEDGPVLLAAAAAEEEAIRIDQQSDRYDLKAEWSELGGFLDTVAVRAAYTDYGHTELEGREIGTQFDQTGLDARLHLGHREIAGWQGTFGLQYTALDLEAVGTEAYIPPAQTTGLGAFIVEQRKFADWTVDVGARIERQEIDVAGDGKDYDGTAFSMAAGLLWDWTDDLSFAMHVTRSERHPQAAELYADGPHLAVQRYEIGDENLDTEIANTIDFGVRRTGAVTWRASVFYSDFSDYIFTAPTDLEADDLPVYFYEQQDAKFYGAEGEVEFPLWSSGEQGLRGKLGADYVRGKLADGGDLPQMPPLRLTGLVEYDAGPLHGSLGVSWYDAQDKLADNELPTDGYTMVDFEVSYRWEQWQRGVLFFLKGGNLLDEEARRHSSPLKDYVPLPGRNLTLGVRMSL